jgi:MFS family permease/ubiquinone/menaquinone biosynthesis C-methylase UbiE
MLPTPSHNEYLLGHSSNEEERLRRLPGELALDSSRFLDQFGIQPGSQAVDLGCGPRGILDLLAERVGKSGIVVGVEQNESTLDLARQFIAERELRNVQLHHGDAKATGLPRASFDVVHARLVLVNVPEPHQVVDEMVGLARPGGIVASHEADWGASICDPPSRAWDRLVAVFDEYSRSLGIDLFVGRKTHQMFREAGLINVQVIPLIHSYHFGSSRRNILCDLLESVHDGVVMRGLLTEGRIPGRAEPAQATPCRCRYSRHSAFVLPGMGKEAEMTPSLEELKSAPASREKLFYGWWVVLTAGLGLGLGYAPIVVYSFGVFLKPLVREFHASRASISLAFTLANLANAITSPLAGEWADRFGPRRVILLATSVFGIVLISSLLASPVLWKLYVFYVVLGIAGSGPAPVPYSKVVSSWFDKRRGLALGLTMFGLGSGAIVIPLVAQRLIVTLGWRGAYATIGLLVVVVSIPVVGLFLKETPDKMGYLPDGMTTAYSTNASSDRLEGIEWHEARQDKAFWMMTSAFFFVGASVHGCVVHLAPMLTDRGITPERAALASSLLGGALLIGRVGSGYLLDHFFAPRVAFVFFGGATLGILLLWSGVPGELAYVAAFFVGLGMGAEVDIIAYLTSRYFGLQAFGEIYGYAFASYALAGALGPWLMGLGFDRTGSYRAVLFGFSAATTLAALIMLRLGPYRYRPR